MCHIVLLIHSEDKVQERCTFLGLLPINYQSKESDFPFRNARFRMLVFNGSAEDRFEQETDFGHINPPFQPF